MGSSARGRHAASSRGFCAETANVTGQAALFEYLAAVRRHVQVVCVQETKVPPDKIAEASARAFSLGWKSVWTPAIKGPRGGWSSGAAVLARKYVDFIDDDPEVFCGRCVAACVQVGGLGQFDVYSTYMATGIGPNGINVQIARAFAERVARRGLPYVNGGDMNMNPADLAEAFP